MPRVVWPDSLMLYSAELPEAAGRARSLAANYLRAVMGPDRAPDPGSIGSPVALRWVNSPWYGFPRKPFKVFRRRPSYELRNLSDRREVHGTAIIGWGWQEMYQVTLRANPSPGNRLVVEALDYNDEVILGQKITFLGSITGLFKCPGIASLRVTGSGVIESVRGVDMVALANAEGWELIEVVGFPIRSIEPASAYSLESQGFAPPSFDGISASKVRLTIADALQGPAPDTGVADFPAPIWPAPEPGAYLTYLLQGAGNGTPSAMSLIRECLANTDDTGGDAARPLQFYYRSTAEVDGLRQADLPDAEPGRDLTDQTVMNLPVVSVVMLSASSDSFAATGLGYGTIDFPKALQPSSTGAVKMPPGTVVTSWDYMVTAEFVMPGFGMVEVAALAQARPPPEAPKSLAAEPHRLNRAPGRDQALTESVKIRWNSPALPQGYAVLVSHKPSQSQVLNNPRSGGGYDPFIPMRPRGANGEPLKREVVFTDLASPLPVSGTQISRYLVAGMDIFGRWSRYALAQRVIKAPPLIAPGLHSAELVLDKAGQGSEVQAKMEVEFSWDWSDRSPDRIEFWGRFVPPDTSTLPHDIDLETNVFQLSPHGLPGTRVIVKFDHSDRPYIASSHRGNVVLLAPGSSSPDHRKYRLTVDGMRCDFAGSSKVRYAIAIRGYERVRPRDIERAVIVHAGSRPKNLAIVLTYSPLPPRVPEVPADIQWTALPDATGRARGLLTWPAVEGAAGYAMWEATEPALLNELLDEIEPGLVNEPGLSIIERASNLRELLARPSAPPSGRLQSFSRLNARLIKENRYEVSLPTGSSAIYAYRVSSVSPSNVESGKSEIVLFAVPRRNVPGQPRLMLRTVKPTQEEPAGRIRVIAMPGIGVPPAAYRVYRVQNPMLLEDVGLKGPAKITQASNGTDEMIVDDVVPESWSPYYYQVVALGREDLAMGEHSGESLPSAVQPGFLPPSRPPALAKVSASRNSTNRVVTFRTDIPVKPTPIGTATIEVYQVSSDVRGLKRERILSVEAHEVEMGMPLRVLVLPRVEELAAMPEINRSRTVHSGRAEFTIRMRSEVRKGVVVVRDPLGRSKEIDI